MFRYLGIVILLLNLPFSIGVGAPPKSAPQSPKIQVSTSPVRLPTNGYQYKLNTLLGLNIVQGSALVSGFQFGYAPFSGKKLYLGPELSFSLFSNGSILAVMVGGWVETFPFSNTRLSLALGGVAGPGFAAQLPAFPVTPLVAFFDAVLVNELDDLVSVRAQIRPGIIGKYFAFMMNFGVSFRFY